MKKFLLFLLIPLQANAVIGPFPGGASGGGGSGTVTSVALTAPTFLSVAGSPVTTSGTLALTLSGTALPVSSGGTGATSLTANNVLLGNGTSALQVVAPGTSGNVLTSNGTTWTSAAPTGSGVTTVGAFSGSSQTNGASISGSTITFGPADTTNPGMVDTASQVFIGNKRFSGRLWQGSAPTADWPFSVATTPGQSGSSWIAGVIDAQYTLTGSFSDSVSGILGQATLTLAGNTASGTISGVTGVTRVTGAGTVQTAAGNRGSVTNVNTATIVDAMGYRASFGSNSGGGTITNYYSFYTPDQTVSTNTYGFYSGITSGSNKYSFYDAGGAANYFSGKTNIGSVNAGGFGFVADVSPVVSSGTEYGSVLVSRKTLSAAGTNPQIASYGNMIIDAAGNTQSGLATGHQGSVVTSGATGTVSKAAGVSGVISNTGAGTITDAASFRALPATNSGGGVITNSEGLYIEDRTAGTNNYGIYSAVTSGSNKYAFYDAGGASSYFTGNIVKINNVTTSWPSSQGAANTYLKNDGSGNLSWATVSGGITGSGTATHHALWSSSSAIGDSRLVEDSNGILTLTNANQGTTDTYFQENITFNSTYKGGISISGATSTTAGVLYVQANDITLSGTNAAGIIYLGVRNTLTGGTATNNPRLWQYYGNMTTANNYDTLQGNNDSYGSYGFYNTITAGSSGSAFGGFFSAYSSKNSVGIEAIARNGVTSGKNYGGRFVASQENSSLSVGALAIIGTTVSASIEGFSPSTGAGLVASNGDTTNDIFDAYDNSSLTFKIEDGGRVTSYGPFVASTSSVLVGTVTITRQIPASVVTLTDGATVALDASLGNVFSLTAAGDRTISAPTNPVNGQKIIILVNASGGTRTITLTTGSSGAFAFGTDITGLTATTSGTTDYIGAIYNSTSERWNVIAYVKGY